MNFDFGFNNSHKKIEVSFDELNELYNRAKNTEIINELIDMQTEISDLHYIWIKHSGFMLALDCGQNVNTPYSTMLDFIANKINSLDPLFKLIPKTSHEEKVNGYYLYDSNNNIMCYSDFAEMKSLFNDDSQNTMTFSEFYNLFKNIACTEWGKMNTTGDNWYVGFWKANDGTDEKKNAWKLTREENAKALFNLPYSKTFLLQTVKFGCSNRMESVRFSNFVSVWFERKLKLMDSLNVETSVLQQS